MVDAITWDVMRVTAIEPSAIDVDHLTVTGQPHGWFALHLTATGQPRGWRTRHLTTTG